MQILRCGCAYMHKTALANSKQLLHAEHILVFLCHLTGLFHKVCCSSIFPSSWKISHITPIYIDLTNYCPVATYASRSIWCFLTSFVVQTEGTYCTFYSSPSTVLVRSYGLCQAVDVLMLVFL